MLSKLIIKFYAFWHGKMKFKGAGWIINHSSHLIDGLQHYPFRLPNGKFTNLDFREQSAFFWINTVLGDKHQEDPLINVICQYLQDGQVFWDVGANAGILSYEISDRIVAREHHYFEPNPKVFPWVTAALSHLENTSGHQIALSNEIGKATFFVPTKGSAYGSLEHAGNSSELEVTKTTGDSLVFDRNMLPPDVIKIDTEGHEVQVIAGMTRIISEFRPVIFFEHIGITDNDVTRLTPPGYLIKTIKNDDGSLTTAFERGAGHNSVLLPVQQVTR
jgi:FkbM family methyltransferase